MSSTTVRLPPGARSKLTVMRHMGLTQAETSQAPEAQGVERP